MRKTVDPLRLFKPRLALFLTCILQVILPTAPQKIISTSDDSRPADNEGNYNMYFLLKKLCINYVVTYNLIYLILGVFVIAFPQARAMKPKTRREKSHLSQ